MKELNENEEKIMLILWQLREAMVKEIMAQMEEPAPPYTTVSSIVRLLEKKGFVDHKAYGKTHVYFPIIPQGLYRKKRFNRMMTHFFDGSVSNVLSFLVQEKKLNNNEIKELQQIIDQMEKEA
ncbi:BlaI/MecI/CopY family transcriptional regulator [Cyclobacterium jeungdonense]|uniref:BlaI/MecI/CopY family transcriptional regulator n=1 Tax=Cyclobacterium jeungdonense TaxID=708087 RepID=A0ABT8C5G8_9BACT|nr:BlaI/MecI/CopY family transcriptional regulator [Cyclobacterium jeungdonense]MDN3687561.1 BlaI/MecI/CopY family transcriptional regulator [Cyclobacterium jeungdonense]